MTLDPNIPLLIIAVLNAFTAFMTYRAHSLIKQVEIATNSMKDALVQATSDASFAAGKDEARGEAEKTAATLLKGQSGH